MKLITTFVSTAALAAMLATAPAVADSRTRHHGFHAKPHNVQRHHVARPGHNFGQQRHSWARPGHHYGNPRAHAPQWRRFDRRAHDGRGWGRDGHPGLHRGHAHAPAHGFNRNFPHRGERASLPDRRDRAGWGRGFDRTDGRRDFDRSDWRRDSDRSDGARPDRDGRGHEEQNASGHGHDRGERDVAMIRERR